MKKGKNNYEGLENFAEENGSCLFGTADVSGIKGEFKALPGESTKHLNTAVSIAFRLSRAVLCTVEDGPTQIYFQHYRQANYFLDNLGLRITEYIQRRGADAMPIPASQVIDRENQTGHLSHRKIAHLAGLGYIGRSNLLVTREFGAGVRLATVLTDYPLIAGAPVSSSCGDCRECINACPAGAIKEKKEDFERTACFRQLDFFRKKRGIGHHICGICVKACRGGK